MSGKGSSGRWEGKRDEGGRDGERVREGGGEVGCGLDDVILDIRWNLHCASTLVILRTQTVQ